MKRIAFLIGFIGLLVAAYVPDASAFIHKGNGAALTIPGGNFPGTAYAVRSNGFPTSTSFVPIIVFGMKPCLMGVTGAFGPTIADAWAQQGGNIQLGMDMGNGSAIAWPGAASTGPGNTFGHDNGEMNCLKAAGIKLIAGGDPYDNTTSVISVASAQAAATLYGYTNGLIGYSWSDEPECDTPNVTPPNNLTVYNSGTPYASHWGQGSASAENVSIHGFDSTRPTIENMGGNAVYANGFPSFIGCGTGSPTTWNNAWKAPDYPSFDVYPVTAPYSAPTAVANGTNITPSDFDTLPVDLLWLQAAGILGQIANSGGLGATPQLVYVEDGSDERSFSAAINSFIGGTSTSSNPTLLRNNSGYSVFTSAWLGLKVTGAGIPANTCIGIINSTTTATMQNCTSHVAVSATATSSSVTVTLSGGINNGPCVVNLCLPAGNEYRATPQQVAAEIWLSFIHGANGIEEFPFDTCSDAMALGDSANCGSAATTAANNMQAIHADIATWATVLNSPVAGECSGQHADWSVSTTCTNGILTAASSTAQVPVAGALFQVGSKYYLFAQSLRYTVAAMTPTFTVTGATGVATLCKDLRSTYDAPHAIAPGTTYAITSGHFSDPNFADGGDVKDNYNFKIYAINGTC